MTGQSDSEETAQERITTLQRLEERAKAARDSSRAAFVAEVRQAAKELKGVLPGPPRRVVRADMKVRKFEEQDGLCGICKEPIGDLALTDMDHVVPHNHGGGNDDANFQLTHTTCNRSKQDCIEPIALLDHLQGRYMNRPKRDT